MKILVVDGANVVGSVPDGWWRDRAGAAARLHAGLTRAELAYGRVVLVLEGEARAGVPESIDGIVQTVHAAGSGDDEIVARCEHAAGAAEVTVATADRGLLDRLAPEVAVIGPRTLRSHLG
ncbi:hypothetical protein [Mobilicoccus caccae]|uniref:NTP pyrophosphohydrolase n=1 Tax=Mobilicoccus caccae TaxID=1859295 RepID=A0ABQ6ILI9_9MICO|nr:hypothetical protein [Mobilicoccus caccae]GMA38068.1 hypothetical protein GCM10025883_01130 [Mobilicoccus caccae]